MDLNTTLGVIGMALILLAFILSQMGEWEDTELRYDLTNLIGSGLMVYYAYTLDSIPFLILNAVWALVSFRDVCYDIKRK